MSAPKIRRLKPILIDTFGSMYTLREKGVLYLLIYLGPCKYSKEISWQGTSSIQQQQIVAVPQGQLPKLLTWMQILIRNKNKVLTYKMDKLTKNIQIILACTEKACSTTCFTQCLPKLLWHHQLRTLIGKKNKDQVNCCMLVFGRLVKIKVINIPRIPEIQFEFGRPWSNFVGACWRARRKGISPN